MPYIETSILINASPNVVRDFFLKIDSHPRWNPFFVAFNKHTNKTTHELQIGDELQIDLKLKNMNHTSTIYPKILQNDSQELRWVGYLISPWLFYGEHSFKYEAVDEGKTLFTQSEQFGGLLSYFFYLFGLYSRTQQSFIEMNEALKDQVESSEAIN